MWYEGLNKNATAKKKCGLNVDRKGNNMRKMWPKH